MVELPPQGPPGRTRIHLPHVPPPRRWETWPPWHAATSPLPARSLGQVLAPEKAAGAEGMPEEGRVCMQERASAHVREEEAGL